MENREGLLLELDEFNRKKESDQEIPQNLENLIEYVAKTGTYIFPWSKVNKLFIEKTKKVINNLSLSSVSQNASPNARDASDIDQLKLRIIERFESFNNAPFTIQRVSELLLKPENNYTQQEKYLRGLEKCLMVVTTVDPNGNKILVENDNEIRNEIEDSSVKAPSTPILKEADTSTNNVDMANDQTREEEEEETNEQVIQKIAEEMTEAVNIQLNGEAKSLEINVQITEQISMQTINQKIIVEQSCVESIDEQKNENIEETIMVTTEQEN
ncbi:unnamed protein product [Brachionus calyciflorus]|uniref:Serine/threonine-protein phosphatase 4 regulatory subunit 2 n=1 Tax=Brachionus calyciflorus TaxID=104777 RepID=A0A813RU20_9BILA|nr:unnamed protein product [Brachionus calyciflorus]